MKSKKRKKLVAMSVFFTFVLSHLSFLFFCVCVFGDLTVPAGELHVAICVCDEGDDECDCDSHIVYILSRNQSGKKKSSGSI